MVKAINLFIWTLKYLLPLVLLAWCVMFLAQKIDLPVADIGRHIKNGEIIVHAPWEQKWQLLHTNFYSYTEPDHEFVNHHWLSGVVFYLIYQLAGFNGLSVFYIALFAAAFYLFFRLAQKQAGSAVAAILSVLILPIITSRAEIRPEGFTYIFSASFFWVLWHWRQGLYSRKWLYTLPLLMLLWVNLHIGFIFGFLILGAFWLGSFIFDSGFIIHNSESQDSKNRFKQISLIAVLSIIAGLINPFFITGLLYPLNIFREYGYLIVENQSVRFLQRLGMGGNLYFGLFEFLLGLSAALFVIRFFKNRNWKAFPYEDFLLLGSAGVLAILAIRNFPIFGFLFLPIAASNIKAVMPEFRHPAYKLLLVLIALVVLVGGSFRFWENYKFNRANFGIGLKPGALAAADFFKKANIKGPIFNNYDIGGYLIFNTRILRGSDTAAADLPADKIIFVDNRPEAYSVDFFQKVYIPAQQDSVKWKELDAKYNFNAIFFSHRDLTPWGQAFLISKVQDSAWAPVYADAYSIIFLKRNEQNVELIRKYLIPRENFGIIKN